MQLDLTCNENNTNYTALTLRNAENSETKESCSNKPCAGVLNCPQRVSNFDILTLFCKYAAIKSNALYIISHNNKVPQVISKECNDVGIWRVSSFEWKCDECYNLFQDKCSVIKRMMTKRSKLLKTYFNLLAILT